MPAPTANSDGGEVLWTPTAENTETSRLAAYLRWLADRGRHFADYQALWEWSVDDLAGFWRSIWDYFDLLADGDPTVVLAEESMPGARWFPDVTLNYAEHALAGPADDVVVLAFSQTRPRIEMTRAQLRDQVAAAATGLRELGVGRGDRVVGYLPNIPEAVVAMLATTSIGAIWACCAPELGPRSVIERLAQLEPTVLIAVDGYRYGTKAVDRVADLAVIEAGIPGLRHTVVVPYLHEQSNRATWSQLCAEPGPLTFERVPFDCPLWVLFSSGTTGLPKAMTHSHGGIVLEQLKSSALQSELGPGDRSFIFCTTSWVMWNILVSGLLVGSAIVLMDGDPHHPDRDELWHIVEQSGATAFGCGAAYLMGCRRTGQQPNKRYDLSTLRGLLSTGSPLPAAGFRWVYEAVSPTLYLNSGSGGTDVCTGFVGGAWLVPVRAGEIACRCLGVHARALDEHGDEVVGVPGELVISAPMPSMPVFFWHDDDGTAYRAAYFEQYPGQWRHGDWATFNDRGGCVITGRSDGTLNRGGVRLGSSEFYRVIDGQPAIRDSLVVHLEDGDGGPGRLVLFLAVADDADVAAVTTGVRALLRRELSPRHVPDDVFVVPEVPYNLTGKKLEVPVKKILLGAPATAVVSASSIRDPAVLDIFEQYARQLG
ncbi:MAG TPA: acetoacetate--CoA ligase [Pseudonocardiaceae bacterium]|nr:acetoacetate--CoA ligase [Pseudonocardiaceae bacterium]